VIDSSGGIYISDYNDCVVEEYNDSGGVVRTVVGVEGVPYTTDDSHLNGPYGIDVDADGNVYVGTEAGYRLVKLGSWSAGTPGVHDNTNQTFGSFWAGVRGVAVAPDGTVYAVDTANQRIQVFDADGTYRTTLGETGVSGTDEDHFAAPEGVAVDDAGNVYVADSRNHRVQIYNSNLVYLVTLGMGAPGDGIREFNSPDNVAVDSDGNIYVADEGNSRVQVFGSNLSYVRTIGSGKLGSPQDVAVDSQGRVYVADIYNNRVQVFAADGDYLTTIGGVWGRGPGGFRQAAGVAVGDDGRVYITDERNHRIQVLVPHVPGWRQVNINGFGNSSNWGAWAVGVFSDTLYASTSKFGSGGEIYRLSGDAWEKVVSGGFGDGDNIAVNKFATFDGQLYAGTWTERDGGEIWRSPSGDSGSWEQVVNHGFGDPVNIEIIALKPFDGQLYAGTYCEDDADNGGEIWRSPSGAAGSWTEVVSDTVFGENNNRAIPSLEVFSDTLYAATANDDTGGEVWRSSNGTSWSQVSSDGFGNTKNTEVVALEVFDGQLYAGVRNHEQGGQIWRTSDGTSWEQVASGGLGNEDNNTFSSLVVVRGELYAIADNNETGVEVFRSSTGDGGSWQLAADTGFGTGIVSQADWEGAATAWDGTLFIGTYTAYGNGGGRVWEMMRQVFLPMVVRH
jgi:sugar lactone lactonase YvrE